MRVKDLQIHVGQDVEDRGYVAISIAKVDVDRDALSQHAPIIALDPEEARKVATLIRTAADDAAIHRKGDG